MWNVYIYTHTHTYTHTIFTGVYGAYLLAVYDPEQEEYQTISKCGTGFSEQALVQLKETLEPHRIAEPKPYYR